MILPNQEQRAEIDSMHTTIVGSVSREFKLPVTDSFVQAIAHERYNLYLLQQVLDETRRELDNTQEQLNDKNQELEKLIYDESTGLLLFDPAMKKSRSLFENMDKNIENIHNTESNDPNCAAVLVIDVEALHIINNRRGHSAGDRTIGAAGDTLIDLADFLNASFRTADRRINPRETDESRRQDIIGRRQRGDELFAVIPFRETDEFTRVRMAEIVASRISDARKDAGAKKLYLHWNIAFYEPGKTIEELQEEADPKATSRLQRVARTSRKVGRAALGKY
jgi:GGDEF domain-containing protein